MAVFCSYKQVTEFNHFLHKCVSQTEKKLKTKDNTLKKYILWLDAYYIDNLPKIINMWLKMTF